MIEPSSQHRRTSRTETGDPEMAYSGQVIDNPVSGERFVFHRTAGDTGGELLAFELTLDPDGHVPGGHVHPVQEERFEVVRGTMRFRRGRRSPPPATPSSSHPGPTTSSATSATSRPSSGCR
jgi:hypothetical protein